MNSFCIIQYLTKLYRYDKIVKDQVLQDAEDRAAQGIDDSSNFELEFEYLNRDNLVESPAQFVTRDTTPPTPADPETFSTRDDNGNNNLTRHVQVQDLRQVSAWCRKRTNGRDTLGTMRRPCLNRINTVVLGDSSVRSFARLQVKMPGHCIISYRTVCTFRF